MKARDARQELAKPTVATLVVLAVAGMAWAAMVHHALMAAWTEWTWASARSSPSP